MCSDSGLFRVGHLLSSLVSDQKRDFPLRQSCPFLGNAHSFHIKGHAGLCPLSDGGEQGFFHSSYPLGGISPLRFCVEVELGDGHGCDGLAVEGLDGFQFLRDAFAFGERISELRVCEQSFLGELLTAFPEDEGAGKLLPGLEVLLARVEAEVVDTLESLEDALLLQELLEPQELHFALQVSC